MKREAMLEYVMAESALGKVLIARTKRGVRAVLFGESAVALEQNLRGRFPDAELVAQPMDEGFEAVMCAIDGEGDVALDLHGTEFQERVWQALRQIPAGQTVSYTQLAEMIGAPKAARAVAGACAANKVAVLVPCHRVLRSDGKLSGYRWGVERKRALLEREGAI